MQVFTSNHCKFKKKKDRRYGEKRKNDFKKVQNLNDILIELSELSDVAINHRKFSSKLINLLFLLYMHSPSSYQLLRV